MFSLLTGALPPSAADGTCPGETLSNFEGVCVDPPAEARGAAMTYGGVCSGTDRRRLLAPVGELRNAWGLCISSKVGAASSPTQGSCTGNGILNAQALCVQPWYGSGSPYKTLNILRVLTSPARCFVAAYAVTVHHTCHTGVQFTAWGERRPFRKRCHLVESVCHLCRSTGAVSPTFVSSTCGSGTIFNAVRFCASPGCASTLPHF